MDGGGARSKVLRLIREYDIEEIGDELVERWTRPDDRAGLRQLAEDFNVELLRAALATGDVEPLDGEIENTYRLLTDDNVSSGERTQASIRLERQGIDVDQLERDFVSKQAIHTYLTKYRNAEPPDQAQGPVERRDRKNESIERLRQRLATVAEGAIEDLRNTDSLALGESDVFVDVRVHCTDCETQYPIRELLAEGHCECDLSER